MSEYWLDIPDLIERQIERAPGYLQPVIKRAIADLSSNPRPATAKELRDRPNRYRIRLDSWRIYYQVDDDAQVVSVLKVGKKGRSAIFYDNDDD